MFTYANVSSLIRVQELYFCSYLHRLSNYYSLTRCLGTCSIEKEKNDTVYVFIFFFRL